MAIGGLWHGAAWGYILWGAAHGAMLVVHKQFKDYCEDRPRLSAFLRQDAEEAVSLEAAIATLDLVLR